MSRGRILLFLFLGISGFLVIYLYYVKQYRAQSVKEYFPHPQVGDVYKMQQRKFRQGKVAFYLKIKDIGAESIYFYHSYSQTSPGLSDVFLNHFDTTETTVYTKRELQEIADGKWDNDDKDYVKILEIVRK